jgi:hypothetical protein
MSCQSHRAICLLLCMRLLIGRHHATVSHPKQINFSTYDTGAYFPSIFHFIFRFMNGTWNVFSTKRNLCPSTRWSKRAKHSWWQMSLWPHMINKLAIQPQIKHSKATKTCQDHIKAFTHERAYMWHFSKIWPSTMDHSSRSSRAKPN